MDEIKPRTSEEDVEALQDRANSTDLGLWAPNADFLGEIAHDLRLLHASYARWQEDSAWRARIAELEEALETICEQATVRSQGLGSCVKECQLCYAEWYRNDDERHHEDCPVQIAKTLLKK